MPVHMFGNSYTYRAGRVHEQYNSTLYAVHWVFTGGSAECKIANARDALLYVDPAPYYSPPLLLTMDLDPLPEPPAGFNDRHELGDTEWMLGHHVRAANAQLQQLYWGIMAAAALNTTLVLPRFQCFCARHWYQLHACRVGNDPHTTFPVTCAMSDMLRARKVVRGIRLLRSAGDIWDMRDARVVRVREWSFLSNPRVPDDIKRSRLTLACSGPAHAHVSDDHPLAPALHKAADGSATLVVQCPMYADDLEKVLAPAMAAGPYRVVHLGNATQLLASGFRDPAYWFSFDQQVRMYAAPWCCRAPEDQKRLGLPDTIQLNLLPPSRPLPASASSSTIRLWKPGG
mmetsp:Transcript_13080/g.32001  ORF Transcript_13080/g.32001 Transcript_13080/m.32001 type:complete len:343 (-) Transcript_13080:507-1535(-)